MDIRPEIEIEVPDNLSGPELVKYLHKEYFGLLDSWKPSAVEEKPKLERTLYAKDKLFCSKKCKKQVGVCRAEGCDNCDFCGTSPETEWPSGHWDGPEDNATSVSGQQ